MPTSNIEGRAERALVKRLSRRLACEGQCLRVNRGRYGLGRYVLIDLHTGNPVAWADDLAEWARETGVDGESCGIGAQTMELVVEGGDAHKLTDQASGGTK